MTTTPRVAEIPPDPSADLPRRVRVLHVIGELLDSGGAERFVTGLVTHLPPERFETWVCAPRGADDAAAQRLREAGVRLVTLGRKGKLDAYRILGLMRLMQQERFDIVHAHLFGSNIWATIFARICGVPVVIAQEHTWSYSGNRARMWIDGHVIGRLATTFVAVSSADAQKMVSVEGVAPGKVVVMSTAYVPHPSAPNSDIRRELGLSETVPVIGTAAVMRPQKALHILLQAHARVLSDVPDAHLIIAGHGPCRGQLEQLIDELGIGAHTHLLGFRSDIDAIIPRCDVAAMSSDFEGTPLFAFECMAGRTTLVATAVGGLPDVIENGVSGLLVAPGSPTELADAILALLHDPDQRRRLADHAAQRLSRYTITAVAEQFSELYTDLLRPHHLQAGVSGGSA